MEAISTIAEHERGQVLGEKVPGKASGAGSPEGGLDGALRARCLGSPTGRSGPLPYFVGIQQPGTI